MRVAHALYVCRTPFQTRFRSSRHAGTCLVTRPHVKGLGVSPVLQDQGGVPMGCQGLQTDGGTVPWAAPRHQCCPAGCQLCDAKGVQMHKGSLRGSAPPRPTVPQQRRSPTVRLLCQRALGGRWLSRCARWRPCDKLVGTTPQYQVRWQAEAHSLPQLSSGCKQNTQRSKIEALTKEHS